MKAFLYIIIIPIIFLSNCTRKDNAEQSFIIESEAYVQEINVVELDSEEPFLTMHVNAQAGLRVRNRPDLNGDRIGLLYHQSEVSVIMEDGNIVNIDGIYGNWVFVVSDNVEGWVFGGFLANSRMEEVISTSEHPLRVWQIVDRSPFAFRNRHGNTAYTRFTDIAYGNGRFVAVGDNWLSSTRDNRIVYSDDGLTWNVVNNRWRWGFDAVTYGNGMFLAVGPNGQFAYSYNAVEWFTGSNDFPGAFQIVFGNNRFVTWTALARTSDDDAMRSIHGLAYSDDGKTWTTISASDISEGAVMAYNLTYTNGYFFVALSMQDRNKVKIAYSIDSITWNVIESDTFGSFNVRNIVYGNGRLLILSGQSRHLFPYSNDYGVNLTYSDDGGRTWHLTEASNDYEKWSWISEITFVNGYFIAVGDSQRVAYSRDGINWVNVDDAFNWINYRASAYGSGLHVIVGTEGMIRISQWSK